MKNLVIFSHPTYTNSTANQTIITELKQQTNLDITIRHLEDLYSDYTIDVKAEQNALLQAENIIWQFPFYWYSVPPALKNWIDKVFDFNFAYGPEGDKLKGKNLFLSITVGGPKTAYNALGYNHFRVEEMLKPLEQTAYLSGLIYQEPIYTHGSIYIPGVYNVKEEVEERARDHAKRLLASLSQYQ